jgi:predicted Zn-dependent peptidase
LQEGTSKMNAIQIADHFDFFGANLRAIADLDNAGIGFSSLKKHVNALLPVLMDMVLTPSFDEKELKTNLNRGKQNLKQNLEKPDFLNRQLFRETLYGKSHPYGIAVTESDYDVVSVNDLKAFHKTYYTPSNAFLFIAGNVDDALLQEIEKIMGTTDWASNKVQEHVLPSVQPSAERKIYVEKEDAVQSCIRIGMHSLDRKHKDSNILRVANTILGGYFGSRLMMNIREDKGYTYGIHSGLRFDKLGGTLVIKTEVGKEVCEDAIAEIYKEMEEMKQAKPTSDELEKVKNYMLGSYLEDVGNILQMTSIFGTYLQMGLSMDCYYETIQAIRDASADEVLRCAQTYFDTSKMYEVVVG